MSQHYVPKRLKWKMILHLMLKAEKGLITKRDVLWSYYRARYKSWPYLTTAQENDAYHKSQSSWA